MPARSEDCPPAGRRGGRGSCSHVALPLRGALFRRAADAARVVARLRAGGGAGSHLFGWDLRGGPVKRRTPDSTAALRAVYSKQASPFCSREQVMGLPVEAVFENGV